MSASMPNDGDRRSLPNDAGSGAQKKILVDNPARLYGFGPALRTPRAGRTRA
jgi:hypothetical protein